MTAADRSPRHNTPFGARPPQASEPREGFATFSMLFRMVALGLWAGGRQRAESFEIKRVSRLA